MNLIDNVNISYYNDASTNISFNEFNIFFSELRFKKDKLEEYLNLLNVRIHIIIIAETWISSQESETFEINGYNSFHCTRLSGGGGGVSIFVDESILVNEEMLF